MTYYSKIADNRQEKRTYSSFNFSKSYKECTPLKRCNKHKKCPHCFLIWKKKQFSKATSHLTEKHLKNWKHKNFLTFVTLDTQLMADEINENIENFLKDLIRSKRYKSSILHDGQYFTMKHISKSDDKGINPHLHMIFLSNKSFKHSKHLKGLLKKYNLRVHNKPIYRDTDNSYLTSIKKLINYMLKPSHDRIEIERKYNLTSNQRDIKKSIMFSKRKLIERKKDRKLYSYICLVMAFTKEVCQTIQAYKRRHKELEAIYKQKRAEAIRIFKKHDKSTSKKYIRWHKSLIKKLELINLQRSRKIKALRRSIFF